MMNIFVSGTSREKEFSSPSFREAFSRRALIVSSVQIQGWFIVSGLKISILAVLYMQLLLYLLLIGML